MVALQRNAWATRLTGLALVACGFLSAGCHSTSALKKKVYNVARSTITSSYDDPEAEQKVTRAEELMQAGSYREAESLLTDVAANTYNPLLLAEKARFLEAECLRERGKYPEAVDTYHKMLVDFPGGAYRERACAQIFNIADYWLDDTRAEIQAGVPRHERYFRSVKGMFDLDRTKPLLDQEGRALQALEYVHTNDVNGPTADKALFWAGYVSFYRQNFQDADHYFSLLIEMHKDSPLRPLATELAVMSKNNSTGGATYDGQKAAEALQLVHHAEATMPEFKEGDKSQFLSRQKMAIRMQQAEKDFRMAEYYERTNHPGSAYFYYEMVRRRYPGTKFSDLATVRMEGLKELADAGPPPPGPVDQLVSGWNRLLGRPEDPDMMGPSTRVPSASANILPAGIMPR